MKPLSKALSQVRALHQEGIAMTMCFRVRKENWMLLMAWLYCKGDAGVHLLLSQWSAYVQLCKALQARPSSCIGPLFKESICDDAPSRLSLQNLLCWHTTKAVAWRTSLQAVLGQRSGKPMPMHQAVLWYSSSRHQRSLPTSLPRSCLA